MGCATHTTVHDPAYDTPAWRRLRRAELSRHRSLYGDRCPGYGVPPHASSDLTLDHVVNGTLAAGVQVLCRGCNVRKRNLERRAVG